MTTRTKFAVCPRCEGAGSHTNPAIDGNGITAEEMDELGEDFREDYVSGVYDIRCSRCNGERVVPTCEVCGDAVAEGTFPYGGDGVDTDRPFSRCDEHLEGEELDWRRSEADVEAMYAAERAMGA